jgi:hypothetical protein
MLNLGKLLNLRSIAVVAASLASIASTKTAYADDTIKRPGDHPKYSVEVEPHVLFFAWDSGWNNYYDYNGSSGVGLGGRVSIPIVENGFIPKINNSVAISFGLDWIHYDGCWYRGNCSANFIDFPVVMQWNFYVAQRWSVFGEPGLILYHGMYESCPYNAPYTCPSQPDQTGIEPALYLGGRFHVSDTVALTMRVGFPSFSFGVSFFP